MTKIKFEDLQRVMSYDIALKQDSCIEIEFCVDRHEEYQESWMGKMLDRETCKPVYWFGLTKDGLQGYDYSSFEDLVNANVFHDSSLKDIWDLVLIVSIDACSVEYQLPHYLS